MTTIDNDLLALLQRQLATQQLWAFAGSFTKGLVIGQLSVILVIAVFVKFFVFADPSPDTFKARDARGIIVRRDKQRDSTRAYADDPAEGDKMLAILEKTYYDVDNHVPETLDWFNVLVAQTIAQLRLEALLSDNIYHSLQEYLQLAPLPEYLDKISLTQIDVGDDFPIFSNCRIQRNPDTHHRLEAKIDVDLSDTLTLGIDTRLVINYPRPRTVVLPIQLGVSIVRFSGCLTVSMINNKGEKLPDLEDHSGTTALMFSFLPDYRLEFSIKSLIGSRAKLKDVPKILTLVENKLRAWFTERCIEPRFQVVPLPSVWPRRKNTREPADAE